MVTPLRVCPLWFCPLRVYSPRIWSLPVCPSVVMFYAQDNDALFDQYITQWGSGLVISSIDIVLHILTWVMNI